MTTTPAPRPPHWRITSDGTPNGTRVYRHGEDISHDVTAITWRIDHKSAARITLDIVTLDLDLDVHGDTDPDPGTTNVLDAAGHVIATVPPPGNPDPGTDTADRVNR